MPNVTVNESPNLLWYSECGVYFSPYDRYKLLYAYTDTPLHTHMDFYEITFIIKGSYVNHYNGESKCHPQNTLIFWGVGQTHAIYQNEPQSIHCSFLVHKDTFSSICDRFHPEKPEIRFTPFAECTLSAESAAYLANISAKGITQKSDVDEYLELFLHTAIGHLFYRNTDMNNTTILDINTCISDILQKLETPEYLLTPITMLYTQYPVCKATLIKSFKQYTGYTIVEYRNKKRMEYSAMLLSSQKYSVTQVASMVGISSFSYFSKKFYEHYGVLPSKYTYKHYLFAQSDSKNGGNENVIT